MMGLVLRIAVAIVALALVASHVDLAEVRDALLAISPGVVALATAASFASNLVISYRLRVLLAAQGVAARVGQVFAINLAAFFYNLFLPVGGVGIAALRLQRLSAESTRRFTTALTAIVCDRLSAVAALGIVGLACWIVDAHAKPPGGLLVLLGGLSTVALFILPRVVPFRIRRIVREAHAAGGGTWWSAALSPVSHALGSVARFSPAALARILAISVVAQLPATLVFVALAEGLGLPVPVLSMGWVRSVVVVLTLLPISIGGAGVREGVLVVALHPFGVPVADALAFSLLVFATTIVAPGVVGGVLEGLTWLRGGPRTPQSWPTAASAAERIDGCQRASSATTLPRCRFTAPRDGGSLPRRATRVRAQPGVPGAPMSDEHATRTAANAVAFDAAYYDSNYPDYAAQNPSWKLDCYLRVLSRHLPPDRPADVLDIGCGPAAWLGHLARHTRWRLAGTDLSEWAIAENRVQLPAVDFRVGSATDEPCAIGSLDAVTACDVLEHVPERDAAAAAIARMLRPGGYFLLVVPVYDGLSGPIIRRLDRDPTHVHKLARAEWLAWMERDFAIVEWWGIVRYLLPGRLYLHFPTRLGRAHTPAILVLGRR